MCLCQGEKSGQLMKAHKGLKSQMRTGEYRGVSVQKASDPTHPRLGLPSWLLLLCFQVMDSTPEEPLKSSWFLTITLMTCFEIDTD